MFQALDRLAGDSVSTNDSFDAPAAEDGVRRCGVALRPVDLRFVGQIATSVWLGYLTDAAARESLLSYAIARRLCGHSHLPRLREALLSEYRLCRERQDLVS